MPFELPPLQYPYDALEPAIDARTMEIHHTKHHQGYVNNLNAALEGTPLAAVSCPFEVCARLGELPAEKRTAVRNNGGGHANHSLFWDILTPKGPQKPSGELAGRIDEAFGGFDAFKDTFSKAALTRFGSGWAWLVVQDDGGLVVCSTPNQDNPVMGSFVEVNGRPILGLDVWEHAYYLKYQNRRADYVAAFWDLVNWERVAELAQRDFVNQHTQSA